MEGFWRTRARNWKRLAQTLRSMHEQEVRRRQAAEAEVARLQAAVARLQGAVAEVMRLEMSRAETCDAVLEHMQQALTGEANDGEPETEPHA